MTNSNGIIKTLDRKTEIAMSKPQRHTAIRKAAETLSRRNADAAVVELLNEALAACVRLVYERDDDKQPSSIDAVTARVLVPLPWGRAGYKRWGLRPREGEILRKIMQTRQDGPGLFLYNPSARSWYLNARDFSTLRAAGDYLTRYPVTVAEYRQSRADVLSGA